MRAIHWSRSLAAAPAADSGSRFIQAGREGVVEISCASRAVTRGERAGGVGQDRVEGGAGLACGDGADDLGVVWGVPAGQVAGPGSPQPEPGGVEGHLADAVPAGGPHAGRAGGGDLVQPVVAAHDEGGGAALGEHGGQDRGESEAGAADQGGSGAGGVGQRAR